MKSDSMGFQINRENGGSGAFLRLVELTKRMPSKTISLSCSVEKAGTLALLGPSGCGKSTVLKMIAGLLPADSGHIILDGRDITGEPIKNRGVGMVFQDYALFPHLSVEDNIGYGLISQGISKKESRRAAAEWLKRFGLAGMEKRRIEGLSGGERQRVALARTLAVIRWWFCLTNPFPPSMPRCGLNSAQSSKSTKPKWSIRQSTLPTTAGKPSISPTTSSKCLSPDRNFRYHFFKLRANASGK